MMMTWAVVAIMKPAAAKRFASSSTQTGSCDLCRECNTIRSDTSRQSLISLSKDLYKLEGFPGCRKKSLP